MKMNVPQTRFASPTRREMAAMEILERRTRGATRQHQEFFTKLDTLTTNRDSQLDTQANVRHGQVDSIEGRKKDQMFQVRDAWPEAYAAYLKAKKGEVSTADRAYTGQVTRIEREYEANVKEALKLKNLELKPASFNRIWTGGNILAGAATLIGIAATVAGWGNSVMDAMVGFGVSAIAFINVGMSVAGRMITSSNIRKHLPAWESIARKLNGPSTNPAKSPETGS